MTADDTTENVPTPTSLRVATWNTYDAPFVRPLTSAAVVLLDWAAASGVDQCAPLSLDHSTSYPVTAEPPFDDGAVHVTDTWRLPAAPVTCVAASGTVAGVTAFEVAENAP